MIVIRQKMIYRTDIQANPHVLYIFGDNLSRTGFGGQAEEMRGEPNSFGIATKRRATHGGRGDYFHDAQPRIKKLIDMEFKLLYKVLTDEDNNGNYLYDAVIIPADGIGTGLSKLPEYAPKLLEYINQKLMELESL